MPITHVGSHGFERPRDRKVERFLANFAAADKAFLVNGKSESFF